MCSPPIYLREIKPTKTNNSNGKQNTTPAPNKNHARTGVVGRKGSEAAMSVNPNIASTIGSSIAAKPCRFFILNSL